MDGMLSQTGCRAELHDDIVDLQPRGEGVGGSSGRPTATSPLRLPASRLLLQPNLALSNNNKSRSANIKHTLLHYFNFQNDVGTSGGLDGASAPRDLVRMTSHTRGRRVIVSGGVTAGWTAGRGSSSASVQTWVIIQMSMASSMDASPVS